MGLEADCVLWNKLENVTAEIGPDFTEFGVGGLWQACKFNNGYWNNAVADYLSCPDGFFDKNKFVYECWFKTDYDVVAGKPTIGAEYTFFSWGITAVNYLRATFSAASGLLFQVRIAGATITFTCVDPAVTFLANSLHHIMFVYDRAGINGGANICRMYFDGALVFTSNVLPNAQLFAGTFYQNIWGFAATRANPFVGTIDNVKIYDDTTQVTINAIIANKENEGWPVVAPPAIIPAVYTKKQPRLLVLNSEIDLIALGYVTKFGKVTEQKTFNRDKVITNSSSIPLQNIDDQFNTDNPTSIFANTNWRYQPVKGYDEDDNLILNGTIDDFPDDQTGKKTTMLVKDALLKLFNTKIEYESANWETPGDSFKNICDLYGAVYNNKYVTDSIAQYELNNCYIWCHFDEDEVKFQQAIEKIAKFGAADCYSANNELCFKLWVEFTGGVKFHLVDKDLAKAVKSKLSRIYYNNYIIGYVGDAGIKATDENNNYIGEVSVKNNDSQDIVLDGSEHQLIEIKDLVSAVFLGEQHIKRSHVNLSTNPFPPLIINFSLPYEHKDFINLQTWFRLACVAKGWDDKLFEVYINNRDYTGKLLNITAYEVDESG